MIFNYTCTSNRKYIGTANGKPKHLVESQLALESQPGTPVLHWGAMPHTITLVGEDIALGDKFSLELRQIQS